METAGAGTGRPRRAAAVAGVQAAVRAHKGSSKRKANDDQMSSARAQAPRRLTARELAAHAATVTTTATGSTSGGSSSPGSISPATVSVDGSTSGGESTDVFGLDFTAGPAQGITLAQILQDELFQANMQAEMDALENTLDESSPRKTRRQGQKKNEEVSNIANALQADAAGSPLQGLQASIPLSGRPLNPDVAMPAPRDLTAYLEGSSG